MTTDTTRAAAGSSGAEDGELRTMNADAIKRASDLAIHATFEAQMGGGAGPFTIEREGEQIVCYRFLPMEQTTRIYAAPYGNTLAYPLTDEEVSALAEHTGWTRCP